MDDASNRRKSLHCTSHSESNWLEFDQNDPPFEKTAMAFLILFRVFFTQSYFTHHLSYLRNLSYCIPFIPVYAIIKVASNLYPFIPNAFACARALGTVAKRCHYQRVITNRISFVSKTTAEMKLCRDSYPM